MTCKECHNEPVGSYANCGGFYCADHGSGALCYRCRKNTFMIVVIVIGIVLVVGVVAYFLS